MIRKLLLSLALLLLLGSSLHAQGPRNKDFGFGIILGDPTGLSGKYWLDRENAIAFSVGNSYFGALRITGDYLWHFDSFKSKALKLYAGPGLVLGIGESGGWIYEKKGNKYWVRKDNEIGVGVRGIFGLNIIPKNAPLEFFIELGAMVGMVPAFGSSAEGAIGVRFYP
ncbi:MAG: hypothetical protein KIT33_02130 [Candidatus Kapabacteria bacterium]|nr:hypothetical protein [Ignavibacteriota bacterium]MCW5883750.1 hypothetical protein [Candidatus Kapabacteria bacterium]